MMSVISPVGEIFSGSNSDRRFIGYFPLLHGLPTRTKSIGARSRNLYRASGMLAATINAGQLQALSSGADDKAREFACLVHRLRGLWPDDGAVMLDVTIERFDTASR